MTKQKVALVGLGMAVTPHAEALKLLADRVEVVAAFSPSAERRAGFAARFGLPTVDSLAAIEADRSLDAVLVLTPPNSHLDVTGRLIAAGHNVLVEKPVEITTARATALVEAAETAGVTLGFVFQNRFRPAALKAHALVASGRLGTLVGISAKTANWRPQSYYDEPGRGTRARDGGGVVLTQAIHTLDLMLWIGGGLPEAVVGFATTTAIHRMETEDLAVAALRWANGALGTVSATTAAYPGYPDRVEVMGTEGGLVLDGPILSAAFQDGTTLSEGATGGGSGAGANPMAFTPDNHKALIADFLDAVATKRPPMISGRQALAVHRLVDALTGSDGRVVSLAG
jgi:predicted dehydrogenase